jgi:hypothetical protein
MALTSLSAIATRFAALVPAKAIAVPVGIALAAGTAAAATYVSVPAPQPQVAAMPLTEPAKPCGEQTWPYIDRRCLSDAKPDKRVRIVIAPPASDAVDYSKPSPDVASKLTVSDGVLRGPHVADPKPAPQPPKRTARGSRFAAQPYQVSRERRSQRETKPMIVIRPLRLEASSGL